MPPCTQRQEVSTIHSVDQFAFCCVQTADEWAEKMPKVPAPTAPKEMANRDILTRVHKAVASHYHVIAQEFENFDTTKSNTVSRDEFRSVCTRHVQILTDEQVGLWLLTPSSWSREFSAALHPHPLILSFPSPPPLFPLFLPPPLLSLPPFPCSSPLPLSHPLSFTTFPCFLFNKLSE